MSIIKKPALPPALALGRSRASAAKGLSFTDAVRVAGGLQDGETRKIAPAAVEMGDQIRMARQRLGLTQKDLAERAKITQGVLSEIERGGGRDGPSYRTMRTLATALGIDLQISPRDGEPVIVFGAGDIEQSTADLSSCIGLLSSGEWNSLRDYVVGKVARVAPGVEAFGRCTIITMGPQSGSKLIQSAGGAVVVAPLRGTGKFTFHKALHRRHASQGTIIGYPVGILGHDSSVTIEPGPDVTSVIMIAAGVPPVSEDREAV